MLVNGKQGNLISIRDRGLLYGDGVFRTLRASHGKAQYCSCFIKYSNKIAPCQASVVRILPCCLQS
jgi:hypothetical protein